MIPKELSFGEVYLPPVLVVSVLAVLLAWLTAVLLNKLRWTRFVTAPNLIFLAIMLIYTVLIGTFAIPM